MTEADRKLQQERLYSFERLRFSRQALQTFLDDWSQKKDSDYLPIGNRECLITHVSWGRVKDFMLEAIRAELAELEKQIEAL